MGEGGGEESGFPYFDVLLMEVLSWGKLALWAGGEGVVGCMSEECGCWC